MKIREIMRIFSYSVILITPILFGIIEPLEINTINKNWIKGLCLIFLVISVCFDIWDKNDLKQYKQFEKDYNILNTVLNKIFEVHNKKKLIIMSEIDHPKYSEEIIRYSVHDHMICVVNKLKDVICEITGIAPINLTVHFMYKHTSDADEDWKWLNADNFSVSNTLRNLLTNKNTTYYQILNTKDTFIFENDKQKAVENERYVSSDKDYYYSRNGSIICAKIDCGKYGDSYIEGIISISSYGRKLVESNNLDDIKKFENIMKYRIIPYFTALLEIEMVSLSLRHRIKKQGKNYFD